MYFDKNKIKKKKQPLNSQMVKLSPQEAAEYYSAINQGNLQSLRFGSTAWTAAATP